MRLSSLPQYKRSGRRFIEITSTLFRYGFAPRLEQLEPEFVKRWLNHQDVGELAQLSFGERVRRAFEELGPTFVKLGQILSTRPDVVPPDVADQLSLLRSGTPPDSIEAVRSVVESDLGQPLEALFAEFDPTPIASASIGQVHAATLHSGQRVVVKVQHPDIEERVRSDFEIIAALAGFLDEHDDELRSFQLPALTREVRRTLMIELDFRRELRSLQRFRRAFEDDPAVAIPAPFPDLSSRRVLTMQRMSGYSIAEEERLIADGHDRSRLAHEGARVFLDMVFREGAFHADPHPGNVFVEPDGSIALIDFGMVGFLDQDLREGLVDLLVAFVGGDARRTERAVDAISTVPPGVDRSRLRRDFAEFQSDIAAVPIEEIDISAILEDFTGLLRRHSILLPAAISMLIKVLVMLEGTAHGLDRSFSLMNVLQPYCEDLLRQRASPRRQARRALEASREWFRLTQRLPQLLDLVSRRVERGEFRVDLVHSGLEATVNRLVSGILCAALLVTGALLWGLKAPPVILGVPVVGVFAVGLALVHGIRLLRQLSRHD